MAELLAGHAGIGYACGLTDYPDDRHRDSKGRDRLDVEQVCAGRGSSLETVTGFNVARMLGDVHDEEIFLLAIEFFFVCRACCRFLAYDAVRNGSCSLIDDVSVTSMLGE